MHHVLKYGNESTCMLLSNPDYKYTVEDEKINILCSLCLHFLGMWPCPLAIYEMFRSLGGLCAQNPLGLWQDGMSVQSNYAWLSVGLVSLPKPRSQSHLSEHFNDKMTSPASQSHHAHLCTKRTYKTNLVYHGQWSLLPLTEML